MLEKNHSAASTYQNTLDFRNFLNMFKDIQIQASGPDGWELLVPIVNNNSYQGHCNKGASLFQRNELFCWNNILEQQVF